MPRRPGSWPDLLLGLLALAVTCGVAVVLRHGVQPMQAAAQANTQTRPIVQPFQRPATGPARVLFIGDELTRGYYATTPAAAFPARLVNALRPVGPVVAQLAASPGATVSTGTGIPTGLALAVIELGSNDVGRTQLATFEAGYAGQLDRIRSASPQAALLCLGVWHADGTDVDAAIRRQCTTHRGSFVPLADYFSDYSIRTVPGTASFLGAVDDRFPDDAGHRGIAGRLLRTITSAASQ